MGVAALMAGCATVPPPIEQMANSKTAISNADSAGSSELAPLELKLAMQKMDGAEKAMDEKNYALAERLAQQSQVDAQLASVTARSIKARKTADALQESSRVLRQEIDRKTQ